MLSAISCLPSAVYYLLLLQQLQQLLLLLLCLLLFALATGWLADPTPSPTPTPTLATLLYCSLLLLLLLFPLVALCCSSGDPAFPLYTLLYVRTSVTTLATLFSSSARLLVCLPSPSSVRPAYDHLSSQIPLWRVYTTSSLSPIPHRRIPAPLLLSPRTTISGSRTCPTHLTTILPRRSRTITRDTGKAARLVPCRPPTRAVPRVRLFQTGGRGPVRVPVGQRQKRPTAHF